MLDALKAGGLVFETPQQEDFVLGNIKARQRMIAQYAVAGASHGLVIGTDHAAEALMGFLRNSAMGLRPCTIDRVEQETRAGLGHVMWGA
jgi:NAD+ synthase